MQALQRSPPLAPQQQLVQRVGGVSAPRPVEKVVSGKSGWTGASPASTPVRPLRYALSIFSSSMHTSICGFRLRSLFPQRS
jgi:hypothetical protein